MPANPASSPQPSRTAASHTADSRTARLDRLPFTRRHGRLILGSGIGWALDAMDIGMISFVMAALAVQWHLTNSQVSLLGSVGFMGMALGASLGGLLADKYGRRQVFAATLLIYGVATGAAALSTSVAMLMALRFLVGVGLGAELPVASTLVAEFAPARIRGRMVVALEAFWAVGWILAALIGYFVIPLASNGWRWALLIGAVPAAYALIVRLGLPESVRFLESRGRHDEAERVVRSFEESAAVAGGLVGATGQSRPAGGPGVADGAGVAEARTVADGAGVAGARAAADGVGVTEARTAADGVGVAEARTVAGAPERAGEASLWSPEFRGRTAALWAVWFGINFSYYGAFIWLPSLLVRQGFDLIKSFEYTLIITLAQLPGYAVAAWLIEVWGRRKTLAVFLLGSAVAAGLFGQAGNPTTIIAAGMALSFFNLGAWGALYAVGPELYPTSVRASGTGAAAAFGRLASILAPLVVGALVGSAGQGWVFALFALAFLVAAVAAFLLPERAGRSLDNEG